MTPKILLAEDDERYRFLVGTFLDKNGYRVDFARDGAEAWAMFVDQPHYDLLLLDIMMPKMSGLELAKQVRAVSDVPIIMLTALGAESDEVTGLDCGADDYIAKPFSYPVLLSRISAQLRRYRLLEEEQLSQGELHVNLTRRSVMISGDEIELTPNEYDLLIFLMKHANQALSRDQILDGVWGAAFGGDWRNVDTHVKRLRSKLGPSGQYLKTVYGHGYRWEKS